MVSGNNLKASPSPNKFLFYEVTIQAFSVILVY